MAIKRYFFYNLYKFKTMTRNFLSGFLLFLSISLIAQKNEFIAVGLNSEMKSDGVMRQGVVFSYEKQLSKHSGFEIGFSQRSADQYFDGLIGINTYQTFHVMENYVTIPFLYKFYSDIVNISTGLGFDYFVGWKDITKFGETELTSYNPNPKFYMGWVVKLGKTFPLSNKFYLEPEVMFNPIFKYNYSYYGVSLKLKYNLPSRNP